MNCDLTSLPHDWLYKTHHGEFPHWGKGKMKYRKCSKCQSVDYLEFTDKQGNKSEITRVKDEGDNQSKN